MYRRKKQPQFLQTNLGYAGHAEPVKLNSKNIKITSDFPGMGMKKLEDGMVPPQSWWQEKEHPQPRQAEVRFVKWLRLLQLSTQSKTKCHTLISTKFLNKKKLNQN